jgi:hypothetical protein
MVHFWFHGLCERERTMEFTAILRTLLFEGRIPLHGPTPVRDEDRCAAESVLREFDQSYRLDCPGQAPELSLPAAVWAAEMFYGAAVAMTYREIDEAGVNEILSRPFPGRRNASGHYSVDLTFRLLPELHGRIKAASRSDPLLAHLENWAKEWPLSSVGLAGIVPENPEEILRHAALRVMYIDRILSRKDVSRLNSLEVREAVKAACGMHHHLAPEVHAAITTLEAQPE